MKYNYLLIFQFFLAVPAAGANPLSAVLDDAEKYTQGSPNVPGISRTANLLMDRAMSEDLTISTAHTRARWLDFTLDALPKLGQANRVAEYFSTHPQVKKLIPDDSLVRLNYVLCRYYSESGQFSKCESELTETKARLKGFTPSLKLDEAKNQYFQGRIEYALNIVNQVCLEAEKANDQSIVPWTYGVVASMQIRLNKLDDAKKTLEFYKKKMAKTDQNPWSNSAYVPRINGSILIQEAKYTEARKVLTQLRTSLIKTSGGIATVHLAWTDFHLLTIAALTSDSAGTLQNLEDLKKDLVTMPSIKHLGIFGEAIAAAAQGKDASKILEPARQQLGSAHPDLQDTERMIIRIKSIH